MTSNKITVCLRRSPIGTTPDQRKNLTGLGLTRRGKWVLLDDTSSNRGMIRKVIHLLDVQKGDKVPTTTSQKTFFEVIPGSEETKSAKTSKTAAKKTQAKPAAKKVAGKTAKTKS